MPVLPSSFPDPKRFVSELNMFVSTRRFDYGGGVLRVAMTRQNGVMRFTEGCLIFQRKRIACVPKTDYGDALFLERWIEPVSKVIDFLPPLLSGKRSIAGQKIATQFTRTDWHHQDVLDYTTTGWREWRFMSRADFLDRNENFHLTQDPLTRNGLVPYINTGHAIADRLYGNKKWNSISSPNQGHFMTILPETRARLLAGEWRPGSVHIEIEANVPLSGLELQILADVPGRRQSRIIRLRNRAIDDEISLDAEGVNVFLVHKSGECLSRTYLPAMFSAFGPQKPTQEVYQRVLAEITNGENDRVEYKVFIEPKDAKEKDIVKAAIAFANTLGGTIYVGVEDDGTLQGETALCAAYRMKPEKARTTIVSRLQALIVESVKPVPNFKINLVEVKQQPVLVIRVDGGSRKPYSNKSHQVWIRKGASDMVPDPQTEFPTESRPDVGFPRF